MRGHKRTCEPMCVAFMKAITASEQAESLNNKYEKTISNEKKRQVVSRVKGGGANPLQNFLFGSRGMHSLLFGCYFHNTSFILSKSLSISFFICGEDSTKNDNIEIQLPNVVWYIIFAGARWTKFLLIS